MKKLLLFMLAVVGSVIAFTIINTFIFSMSVIEYVIIELIITASHWLYNKAKEQTLTTSN